VTPGEILRTLLDEATDVGLPLVFDFSEIDFSDGDWPIA
jgi:hypothetical protein